MTQKPATTNKCGNCGHAKSAHSVRQWIGIRQYVDNTCKHYDKCLCEAFVPQIDSEKFNSLDGLPAVNLYEFQEKYLEKLPSKYIFAADTGTGKSFMSIAHYDRKAYLTPLLILAPAAKVKTGDWERDIKQYFQGRIVPEYKICSYEKFSREPSSQEFKKGKRAEWRMWLEAHPNFAIIADEVHKAKNPQSGVGIVTFKASQQASFFIGLSATPMPNGWIDAANYFKIFGFVKHITEFKSKFCDIVTYKGFPEIRGYKDEYTLKNYWNDISKPLSKDQALDLPSVTSVPVVLERGTEYSKLLATRMLGEKFLDNPSALMHALRQSVVEPKIKWLDDFLEGVSDNVVIFYNYVEERDRIIAMIHKNHKKRKVFEINGQRHETPEKHTWSTLNRTITLAQYQSGSTGIELTYAATTVYFSPTYSYSNYEQSIGRTNRNGQTKKMTLYLLCSPTTVEKDIWAALRNKSDFQAEQWLESQGEK